MTDIRPSGMADRQRATERLWYWARVSDVPHMDHLRKVLEQEFLPLSVAWRDPWRTPEGEYRVEQARQFALKEPLWRQAVIAARGGTVCRG